jgi:hypothetical protein
MQRTIRDAPGTCTTHEVGARMVRLRPCNGSGRAIGTRCNERQTTRSIRVTDARNAGGPTLCFALAAAGILAVLRIVFGG